MERNSRRVWVTAYRLLVSAFISIPLLAGCGGGGGSNTLGNGGVASSTGMLTVSADPVSVTGSVKAASNLDVNLDFAYTERDKLNALDVLLQDASISYTRTDCASCPTLPDKSIAVNKTLKVKDTYTLKVPVVSSSDLQQAIFTAVSDSTSLLGGFTNNAKRDDFIGYLVSRAVGVYNISDNTAITTYTSEAMTGQSDKTNKGFYKVVSYNIIPGSVQIIVNGATVATDDGNGSIQGGGTGTVNYTSKVISVTLTDAPDVGQSVMVAYAYHPPLLYGITGETQNLSLSPSIMRGSLTVWLGSTQVARDDGRGNISKLSSVANYIVSGTINYVTGDASIVLSPPPSTANTPLTVYYVVQSSSQLTYPPIQPGSMSVNFGTGSSCKDTGNGTFLSPCYGSVDYSSGAISFGYDGSIASTSGGTSVVVSYTSLAQSLGGEVLVNSASGSASTYNLKLTYAPVSAPKADGTYYATIITTDGLMIRDRGGYWEGDVCGTRQSTIDYSSGNISICFSRPVRAGEKIIAYYRAAGVSMNANIKIHGHEINGNAIELNLTVPISITE